MYALVLKDGRRRRRKGKGVGDGDGGPPPLAPLGVMSSLGFEARFVAASPEIDKEEEEEKRVWLPWDKFVATYRGRAVEGEEGLRKGDVRRVGIMMRRYVFFSFFGKRFLAVLEGGLGFGVLVGDYRERGRGD